MPPKTPIVIRRQLIPVLALSFWAITPLITFILLWLKGFPSFAQNQPGAVLIWVYEVCWAPSLAAGLLLSWVVYATIRRFPYFHRPYDFGRCFSLGAILGALLQAFTTMLYRSATGHPFSDFWIAGALIAGALTGSLLTSFFLRNADVPGKA